MSVEILCLLSCMAVCEKVAHAEIEPGPLADVFIGTSGLGHVTPAAAFPFGFVQAGPDTAESADRYLGDWKHTCGYQYADTNLFRFSQLHLNGSGCGSLGNLGLLPVVDEVSGGNVSVPMDKATERGAPGWYSVRAGGVDCEMTALAHSAAYRFAYPAGSRMRLLVDADWGAAGRAARDNLPIGGTWTRSCELDFRTSTHCAGHVCVNAWVAYDLYWAMEFSRPVVSRRKVQAASGGRGEIWMLDFGLADAAPLEVRLALSSCSTEGAARNLSAEMPRFDFAAYRRAASDAWAALLGRIRIEGAAPDVLTNFKSALYRLMLQPNNIADAGESPFYSTFSLWDTYRAAHPLYTIVAPERVDDFVRSLLRQYRSQGFLPMWALMGRETHCMIGHHSVPVIVDAYLKGFRGFDAEEAYSAVLESLTRQHKGDSNSTWGLTKEDWSAYDACGYVPLDGMGVASDGRPICGESVSRTLECAYDDACAARFAAALGRKADAELFTRRSGYWKNVLDPETGFVRGRKGNGEWRTPFDPLTIGHCWWQDCDFTEGNSWQWTFHVMQDPQGLVAALGGPRAFGEKLDRLFSTSTEKECAAGVGGADVTGLIGQYAHGNEPSHHTAYFFRWSDRPKRTDEIVRRICETQYRPQPDGLCGNDDCGQMAAWYVFSCMGFYPFDPCGGIYTIGSPQVPKAVLSLPGGKKFTVIARGLSDENRYVRSVTLNGKKLSGYALRHAEVMRGGELVLEMTDADGVRPAANGAEIVPENRSGGARPEDGAVRISADDGRYNGWPTVTRLKDGTLAAVWSGGRDAHICPNGRVLSARSADGGRSWSAPETLADGPLDDRDAGLLQLSNGDLVLFWFTSVAFVEDEGFVKSQLPKHPDYLANYEKLPKDLVRRELGSFSMRSTDGGKTWEPKVRVPTSSPHGGIELKDGRLLVVGIQDAAVRGHLKGDPGEAGEKTPFRFVVAASDDRGRSWRSVGEIPPGEADLRHASEPCVIEGRDGVLRSYLRYGTYHYSESRDGGRTWTPYRATNVPGCQNPAHLLRLKDGRVLMSSGRRVAGDRAGEAAAGHAIGVYAVFSADDARPDTWDVGGARLLKRFGCNDMGYASSVELDDGSFVTVCYGHDDYSSPASIWSVRW